MLNGKYRGDTMTVRELLMQDDLNKVSELLWLSDSYIMGDLFGSLETARIIGPYIFSDDKKALLLLDKDLGARTFVAPVIG